MHSSAYLNVFFLAFAIDARKSHDVPPLNQVFAAAAARALVTTKVVPVSQPLALSLNFSVALNFLFFPSVYLCYFQFQEVPLSRLLLF